MHRCLTDGDLPEALIAAHNVLGRAPGLGFGEVAPGLAIPGHQKVDSPRCCVCAVVLHRSTTGVASPQTGNLTKKVDDEALYPEVRIPLKPGSL